MQSIKSRKKNKHKRQSDHVTILLENIYKPILLSEEYSEFKRMESGHTAEKRLLLSRRKKKKTIGIRSVCIIF